MVVTYAAMIVTMMTFAGLAVDVGYMQYSKRRIQAAADAAAMGALRELELGNSDITSAGANDAALNGFTNGANGTTVTVSNPPASGPFAGQATAVEAVVTRTIPIFFMGVVGAHANTITASATARTSTTNGSVGACIFVMDPTASPAFKMDGNVSLTTACGAVVDSTAADAFTMVGGSTFTLGTGAQVGVVGPGDATAWSLGGTLQNTSGVAQTPVNIQSFNDPLANIAAPTPGSVSGTGYTFNNDTRNIGGYGSTSIQLSPGVYCGGIAITSNPNTLIEIDFLPGTYVLAGGGLTINSSVAVRTVNGDGSKTSPAPTGVTPAGAMFYNTDATFANSIGGCKHSNMKAGSVSIAGGANVNLQGLTVADGANKSVGVLFFDDRSVTGLKHNILGSSTSTFDGAMYFLNAQTKFAGTNQTPGFLYLVTDTLEINGTSNLGNDHSNLASVNILAPTSTGGGLVQ